MIFYSTNISQISLQVTDTLKLTACVNADILRVSWEYIDQMFSGNSQDSWTFLKMFLSHLLNEKPRESS